MNHHKVFPISAFVLVLFLQACSSNAAAVRTPTHVQTATTPPETLQITPIPFGSDVNIDGMKFVIAGAIRPADGLVSSGDMFNAQPHEYQQYIFVTLAVTCEATADGQCHLNLFKIKLLGPNGSLQNPKWFISGVESILKETDFPGGRIISGNVPFIVSVGDSGLRLVYESLSGDSFYFALP